MDSFKYLGMVCDRRINLNTAADAALHPITAGTFGIKQSIREHDLTNRLHIYMWLLKKHAIPASVYASHLEHPVLTTGQRNGTILYENGCHAKSPPSVNYHLRYTSHKV